MRILWRLMQVVVSSGLLLLSWLAACGQENREYPVMPAGGNYRVVFGQGYEAADEARLLAVTAHLDRATNQLVFYLADGSQQVLAFSPRPRSQWQPDCYTVADLSPAPLRLESLTFLNPLVFVKCAPSRMLLANTSAGDESLFLAFDLE